MPKVVDAVAWLKSQTRDRRLEHEIRIYGPREQSAPRPTEPVELVKLSTTCKAALRAAKERSGLTAQAIAIECNVLTTHIHAATAVGDSYCARRRIPRRAAEELCRLFHVKLEEA